ncbi:vacuolar protein-sorting protein 36 [Bacillus cereus]
MGVSWVCFKRYEIVKHEENDFDDMICFFDEKNLRIAHATCGTLRAVFAHYKIHIPIYNQFEPPNSKELELVSPVKIAKACEEAIKILKEGINPEFEDFNGEKNMLWELDDLDGRNGGYKTIPELNCRIIDHLERIKLLSNQGYYFIQNED